MTNVPPSVPPQGPPQGSPYGPQYGPGPAGAGYAPPVQKTSGLAVASLVLGVLGFVSAGLLGLVGLIMGIIAAISTSKNPQLKGKGLAIAGAVLGGVSLLMVPLMISILLPSVGAARDLARQAVALSQMNSVGQAMMMYETSDGDRLPSSDRWKTQLTDAGYIMPQNLVHPADNSQYMAMNFNLDGKSTYDVSEPSRTVLVFECKPGTGSSGGPRNLANPPRGDGVLVLFCDGHVEAVDPADVGDLKWTAD